ncbi:hypothetical protein CYMTET_2729 [Cymbomonas tetramitiformis]|uniref:RING-type E3 ubiquitin transferase n=1 Tax=Cymbomonas tetramitiformis TaxID=36881 RepID=A0AAE0H4I0_9CHLO|nr:hypothetical protein CYMTET_2729 [Cymbomonas tetramitiformis]
MSVSMCMPMRKYDDYAGEPVKDDKEWEDIKRKKEESRDDMCTICLEFAFNDDKNREAFQFAKCGHVFHFDCVEKALKINNNCPNCREHIHAVDQAEIFIRKRLEYKHAFQEGIRKYRIGLVDIRVGTSKRKLMEEYDLVDEVYSALVECGILTVDDMQHVRATPAVVNRLKAEAVERDRYIKDISSKINRLTMDDIDSIRDKLKRYNALSWFCQQLVRRCTLTIDKIDIVRDDLNDEQLRELYRISLQHCGVTVDEIELVQNKLEEYDLMVNAYEELIVGQDITMDNIEVLRKGLETYDLMKVAYKESIIGGFVLTMDNIEQAREDLEKFNLMSEAYDMMIDMGYITMDNIEQARKDLETYNLMREVYKRMIFANKITKNNIDQVREDLEKYNLMSKVDLAIIPFFGRRV